VKKLCSDDEFYTVDKAKEEFSQLGCCTCDFEDREDDAHCCDWRRASREKPDWCLSGYVDEEENRGKRGYANMVSWRNANRFFYIQCVVFVVFGFSLILFPDEVATRFLLSEEYLQQNNLSENMSPQEAEIVVQLNNDVSLANERIEQAEVHRNKAFELLTSAVEKAYHMATNNALLAADGNAKTEAELRLEQEERDRVRVEALRELEMASRIQQKELAKKSPVHLTVTSFCRFYGAACVFFGYLTYGAVTRESKGLKIYSLRYAKNILSGSVAWYACGLGALILSSVAREGGNESTNYVSIVGIVYAVAMFGALHLSNRIGQIYGESVKLAKEGHAKYRQRSEEIVSLNVISTELFGESSNDEDI
jgi:tetratricopeptide (TPR) repeat protein